MDHATQPLFYADMDRRDLTTMLLLRLVELSPSAMQALITGFTQLCNIEAEHAKYMSTLGAQIHTSTLSSLLPLAARDSEEPPSKRMCVSHPPPVPVSGNRLSVLERLSNATYHGMENLTHRVFRNITVTKAVALDCKDVAQGVLDWIHRSGVPNKKKQFTVRPCNRRTGDMQMVYTHLPSSDPIDETIAVWILSERGWNKPPSSPSSPEDRGDAPLPGPEPIPDLDAFDPLSAWCQFQKVFPVMAIYRSQWLPDSNLAHAVPPSVSLAAERMHCCVHALHGLLQWPSEIEMECVIQLAQRLYPHCPWTTWLVKEGEKQNCHIECIGILRRTACILHGFILGSNSSCSSVWEAINMPNRSGS